MLLLPSSAASAAFVRFNSRPSDVVFLSVIRPLPFRMATIFSRRSDWSAAAAAAADFNDIDHVFLSSCCCCCPLGGAMPVPVLDLTKRIMRLTSTNCRSSARSTDIHPANTLATVTDKNVRYSTASLCDWFERWKKFLLFTNDDKSNRQRGTYFQRECTALEFICVVTLMWNRGINKTKWEQIYIV